MTFWDMAVPTAYTLYDDAMKLTGTVARHKEGGMIDGGQEDLTGHFNDERS